MYSAGCMSCMNDIHINNSFCSVTKEELIAVLKRLKNSSPGHTIPMRVYVTANLWNQIFPGIPNPFRESGEYLKCIEIPRNL